VKFLVEYPVRSGDGGGWLEPENLVRFARAAEAGGIDAIALTDHPAPPRRWLEAGGHETLDPFVGLAYFAAATERIALMTHLVVAPYRNPLLMAKAMTSLDVVSGGRTIFALGAGYLRSEFRALGVDFDDRNDLFDESLSALTAVWSSEVLDFDGRGFTARGQVLSPGPRQRPHPPIWIGGNSARARERVARWGQGWSPMLAPAGLSRAARTAALESLDDLAVLVDDLGDRLEAHGRHRGAVDICVASPLRDQDVGAAAKVEAIEALAALGVTWTYADLDPSGGVDAALEHLEAFCRDVVAAVA